MRGADMFIVQTHSEPVNDSIMEQLIMVDAAKRASARRITAVCPYYGYSRQDRKSTGREPITAKLVADVLSVAGVDRVVSVDLHSGQIQGFFDVPVDHLTAAPVLLDYLRRHAADDLVIVAPDAGRVKVAESYSQLLATDLAFVHKRRPRGTFNQVEAMDVVGNVKGRPCVIIDDMIDTAGTVAGAAYRLVEAGATDIWAMATHALLSDPALDRLNSCPLSRVIVTNTLPLPVYRRIPEARGAVDREDRRGRDRRRVRGHFGLGDLRWPESPVSQNLLRSRPSVPTPWLGGAGRACRHDRLQSVSCSTSAP